MNDFVLTSDKVRETLANTLQIVFEVTDACNLRCEYCAYGSLYGNYDQRENRFLSLQTAICFIEYMERLWKNSKTLLMNNNVFVSFYGGEPLLNFPFIKEVVNYLKTKAFHRSFKFNMTTNAMLLDKHMDFLVDNSFELLISLDGNYENNSYRKLKNGLSSFERVTSNIDKLRYVYPDYFENHVSFNSVLHNRNTVIDILGFIKDKYGKVPDINEINDTGILVEKKDDFYRMYRNTYDSLFKNENYGEIEREMFLSCPTYHSAMLFLLHNSEFKYDSYNELLYGKNEKQRKLYTGTCIPFSRKVFVTVNGKIMPCERIGHHYELGFVDDKEVVVDFNSIAAKYNDYYQRMAPQCRMCKNQKDCVQCVFQIDGFERGNNQCFGFMNEVERKRFVQTQLNFFSRHPEAYSEIMNKVIMK